MSPLRLSTLTALAVIAFAANAVLCRLAFTRTGIDPASFTAIRLASLPWARLDGAGVACAVFTEPG